jgi:hypothetical protein
MTIRGRADVARAAMSCSHVDDADRRCQRARLADSSVARGSRIWQADRFDREVDVMYASRLNRPGPGEDRMERLADHAPPRTRQMRSHGTTTQGEGQER